MPNKPWWEEDGFFKGSGRELTRTDIFLYGIYDGVSQAATELSRELSLSSGQTLKLIGLRTRMYRAKSSLPSMKTINELSPEEITEAKKDVYDYLTKD